jgi:hypothetical protein
MAKIIDHLANVDTTRPARKNLLTTGCFQAMNQRDARVNGRSIATHSGFEAVYGSTRTVRRVPLDDAVRAA